MNIQDVGVAPFSRLRIFNPEDARSFAIGAALGDFKADELAALGRYFLDGKRKILSGGNLHLRKQRGSRRALEKNPLGPDFYEFFNDPADGQVEPRPVGVIGFDMYSLPDSSAAEALGADRDLNSPLLPGRDLARAGRSRAASTGLDIQDLKVFIAPVVDHEFMHHRRALQHRLKLKDILLQHGLRPC